MKLNPTKNGDSLASPKDGHTYILLRSRGDEQKGIKVSEHNVDHASALVVSGEVFAAVAISQALPQPLDLTKFQAGEDEAVVSEVQRDVYNLATETGALLEIVRNLRRELKAVLALVPEWNQDEVSGLLHRSLALDVQSFELVRDTLGKESLIGLGEGNMVPPFLRFEGILPLARHIDVASVLAQVWLLRTKHYLMALAAGWQPDNLGEYMDKEYLVLVAPTRMKQMEHMYNFLINLRKDTSIGEQLPEADMGRTLSRPSPALKRGGSMSFNSQGGMTNQDSLQSSHPRNPPKMQGNDPKLDFIAGAEVLYRSLIGNLHEDIYHDQTAMLVALSKAVVAFSGRLLPCSYQQPLAPGEDDDLVPAKPVVMGLAELSSILRLFFPAKPREHLNELKQKLLEYASTTGHLGNRRGSSDSLLVIDVGKVMGLDMQIGRMPTKDELLTAFIVQPTPIVQELRRQH
eukprot:3042532-Amphidinium_carterae.1